MTDQNEGALPQLKGEQLLEQLVVDELRRRQRHRGMTLLLEPYPPCPVCGQSVDDQKFTLGVVDFDDRVLRNSPCGHLVKCSMKAATQLVGQAEALADERENRTAPTEQPAAAVPATWEALRAVAFNAVAPALRDLDQWLPLSARRAVADKVLEAVVGCLDVGEEQAWCKSCRRVWEGRTHSCETPAEREAAAARQFAAEMRDFCSPHNVAPDYADRLIEAMDRAKESRG